MNILKIPDIDAVGFFCNIFLLVMIAYYDLANIYVYMLLITSQKE